MVDSDLHAQLGRTYLGQSQLYNTATGADLLGKRSFEGRRRVRNEFAAKNCAINSAADTTLKTNRQVWIIKLLTNLQGLSQTRICRVCGAYIERKRQEKC